MIKQPIVAFIKKNGCFAKFDFWCIYLKSPVTCHQIFLWKQFNVLAKHVHKELFWVHLPYLFAADAEPILYFTKHYNWVKSTEAVFRKCYVKCVIFFTISENLREKTCTRVLFLTKMMAVKRISADGCFWFLAICFYNSKCWSRTENHAHASRHKAHMTKVHEKGIF